MKQRQYSFSHHRAETEEGGKGAWTDRISSPCSIASCLLAAAAALLAGFGLFQSVSSAGAVSVFHAGLSLCAMPVSIAGLWLGIRGRYDRQEKRQIMSLVGCVANGTLYILMAGAYAAGLLIL